MKGSRALDSSRLATLKLLATYNLTVSYFIHIFSFLMFVSLVGKYTFEVSSRSKSQVFLAEREEDKRAWVRAVSRAVAKCPQPAQLPLWTRVNSSGPRPTPRSNHTTIYTAKHIVVFGGQRHSTWFNDCYICDAETMEWIKVPDSESVPTPRSEHAAVTVDDKIYIFGGFDGSHRLNDLYIFDVKTLR